jgi:hypothetical protein
VRRGGVGWEEACDERGLGARPRFGFVLGFGFGFGRGLGVRWPAAGGRR